ncbi:MAG: hypothetical protein KJO75_23910 [Dactylosporangium sp.]|nr:hypothetical protein [Dactylosporangium sp.]
MAGPHWWHPARTGGVVEQGWDATTRDEESSGPNGSLASFNSCDMDLTGVNTIGAIQPRWSARRLAVTPRATPCTDPLTPEVLAVVSREPMAPDAARTQPSR